MYVAYVASFFACKIQRILKRLDNVGVSYTLRKLQRRRPATLKATKRLKDTPQVLRELTTMQTNFACSKRVIEFAPKSSSVAVSIQSYSTVCGKYSGVQSSRARISEEKLRSRWPIRPDVAVFFALQAFPFPFGGGEGEIGSVYVMTFSSFPSPPTSLDIGKKNIS